MRDTESSDANIRHTLARGRGFADERVVRYPAEWIAVVDAAEAEVLGPCDDPATGARLLDRYLFWKRRSNEGFLEAVRIGASGGDHRDRPPVPLIEALIEAYSAAILGKVSDPVAVIRERQKITPPEALETLWLLYLLAESGDPRLADYFTALTADEIRPAVQSMADNMAELYCSILEKEPTASAEPAKSVDTEGDPAVATLTRTREAFAVYQSYFRKGT